MNTSEERTIVLRSPASHRAGAIIGWIAVFFFISRFLARHTSLPEAVAYGVCALLAVILCWRSWNSRVEITTEALIAHNTLATSRLPLTGSVRITDGGKVFASDTDGRRMGTKVEVLTNPWWALFGGDDEYVKNREQARRTLRAHERATQNPPPADPT